MIRLRALGPLSLENDEAVPVDSILAQPKRLALLVYLSAIHPAVTSSRDTLLALLWPELDDAHARAALRQGLYLLRRTLDSRLITGAGDERIGVDPSRLWCDAAAFGAALTAGDPAGALTLYRGPFLDGFHVWDAPEFERWVERQRHCLERDAVAAACRLLDAAEAAGDRAGARQWAERALELAPYDAEILRRYLVVLEGQADAAGAIAAFAVYERHLAEDLALAPSAETLATIERIRAAASGAVRGARPPGLPRSSDNGSASTAPGSVSPIAERTNGGHSPEAPGRAPRRLPRWLRWTAGIAALLMVAGTFQWVQQRRESARAAASRRYAIAVLPFRDLSSDSSHSYFAAGLHDELLADLSKVSSLRVVGRTSVSGYERTTEPLAQIARELGVGTVVEGSVQVVGNHLRVVVALADPFAGTNLWVERYERPLDDAFAVQSEIAERIVDAVGATLTTTEARAMHSPPAPDGSAYQLYLAGQQYARRPGYRLEDALAAQQLFERALALDSSFAPAHAALAMTHWQQYHRALTPDQLAAAQHEAMSAARLQPDLPEVHLAVGLALHQARGDFRGALDEFRRGLQGAPNNAALWKLVAMTHRSLGEWDSAFAALDHARRLEPRDADLAFMVGSTHHYLHEYAAAIAAYREAFALAPDLTQAHVALAWSYALWKGQLDTLRAVLQAAPPGADPGANGASITNGRLVLLLWDRKADSLLAAVRAARATGLLNPIGAAMMTARAQTIRGDTAAARVAWDAARVLLDSAVRATPGDYDAHGARGAALGILGRRAEALGEARWLGQPAAYGYDRFREGWAIGALGTVLVGAGQYDEALRMIERQMVSPSLMTVPILRLSPEYDPIRTDPRFQALLREYAVPVPVRRGKLADGRGTLISIAASGSAPGGRKQHYRQRAEQVGQRQGVSLR